MTIYYGDAAATATDVDSDIATLQQKIVLLQGQIENLENRNVEISQRHSDDVRAISLALLEEAGNRGWCSEFDTFVDNLNPCLHEKLLTRERDYFVDVLVRVIVTTTPSRFDPSDVRDEISAVCDMGEIQSLDIYDHGEWQ